MIALPLLVIFTALILVRVHPLLAAGVFVLALVGGLIWFLATHFTIVIVPLGG